MTEQIVYISCVDEVRSSFVSHLSNALRRNGIPVYVDAEDLLSEEAQAKFERAKVSVIVLPGNRKVCLDKLVTVLNCRRNDQVVVPVLYGDRLLREEWLSALQKLSGLSQGHEYSKECGEFNLVEEIARDVNEKLLYMGRVGLCSKLLEVENMINKQPLGIRQVGIWGMPGIGKTTLAKAVFDQVSGGFDACCFIEDYDKAFHENRLYRILVEQLMKDEPGNSGTITKLRLRRDKLKNKRVLVVLDDVRIPLLAESFLDGFDWFGPESLIIITSRDKQVFRHCRINQIYEVQGLNEKEAIQLFMLYASIDDMGEHNLHELLTEVIKHADGNPLALSMYGRELNAKKRQSEMETTFLELKEHLLSMFVDVIKRSYETLSDSEKNIFLDIACFFRGENVDYVMQLLEGCDFFPHVGVDVLVDKCLLNISGNILQMHNLIQDVGREILNERRRRLWEPWSIKYLIEDIAHKTTFKCAQGTNDIEGMFLDTSSLGFDVKHDAFENMLNLRLLKIYSSNSEIHPVFNFPKGFLRSLPKELRLLHWENYPLESLPRSFDPMHLVEINMPYSQLQKLWGGTKNLEMLRTIRLCNSQQLVEIDDVSNAPNLEVIDLQGCTRLQSFPATDQLLHLRVVNLSGCTEIKSFQEVPPNVETLHLQGTGITELPLSIVKPNGGKLMSFLAEFDGLSDALKLERLKSLKKSSSSCQDLGKLICLELKDCSRLRSLPNMVNLELLTVLDLSGCSKLESIQGFPRNLKELYLTGTAVRKVPQLPQSLELFNAHGCVSLKEVPLDSEKLHMHYRFSNCFNISPQVFNDFLVKVLSNVKHIPRELPQKLNKALAFSFCGPSHVNQNSTLGLQPGSSVMTRLNASWRDTLVGFVMLVEVAFSEDYYDTTGFGISCVCRWKDKEGHSEKIERHLHCWAPEKAVPKVQKNHMFVFCDAQMRPSTSEESNPDIFADLLVFEFFPVDMAMKRLDDNFTVTSCGVYEIAGNTDLKMSSPDLSLDPMEVSGSEVEEVLRVSYDGLPEADKALFLYLACLFNDEDFDLVAPLLASIDLDVSTGLKVLANSSLIRVSSNGQIVMQCFLRNMGKEILHKESVMPGISKKLTRDFKKDYVASFSSRNWKYDIYPSFRGEDVRGTFLSYLIKTFEKSSITVFKDTEIERGQAIGSQLVQARQESKIVIVVFSRKYASSSWLLDELVEIVQSHKEICQPVIPIYYDVDPSDVRNQTGEFGRQFEQACKNKTEHEKERWCRALTDMAALVGYIFNKSSHMSEGEFIASIVMEVNILLEHIGRIEDQIGQPQAVQERQPKAIQRQQPQVFINFRGEDVRNDFLDYLVHTMKINDINVFIDKHEVRGLDLQDLLVRIEQSKVAIAIFSDKYTTSEWCLNELVKIKECADRNTLIAIPVFYKVATSDVTDLEGDFGNNFRNLKRKHHHQDTVKTWEDALASISRKYGMVLSAGSHIPEREFIDMIITEVKKLLEHIGRIPDQRGQPLAVQERQLEAMQRQQPEANQRRHPVLNRQGCMFNVRELKIGGSHNARYWTFVSISDKPNEADIEVARMRDCWYLEVCGKFDTSELTYGTRYEVVFVVKVEDTMSRWDYPAKVQLMVPDNGLQEREFQFVDLIKNEWVDIQAGVFVAQPHKEKIAFYLYQHNARQLMTGLVVKGAIIRPMD